MTSFTSQIAQVDLGSTSLRPRHLAQSVRIGLLIDSLTFGGVYDIASTQWGQKRYLRMELLKDLDDLETHVA